MSAPTWDNILGEQSCPLCLFTWNDIFRFFAQSLYTWVTEETARRALAARDTRGLIKLVADASTDRLLGGVIMAPEGADSVQTLAMALKAGMTAQALGETIFPYLTTVEGLKLAAQTFDMDVAKLSCCAG